MLNHTNITFGWYCFSFLFSFMLKNAWIKCEEKLIFGHSWKLKSWTIKYTQDCIVAFSHSSIAISLKGRRFNEKITLLLHLDFSHWLWKINMDSPIINKHIIHFKISSFAVFYLNKNILRLFIIITAYHNVIPRSDWQITSFCSFIKLSRKQELRPDKFSTWGMLPSADKKNYQKFSKYGEMLYNKIEELLIMSSQT